MAGSWGVDVAWDALAKDEEFVENFDGAALDPAWTQYGDVLVGVDGSGKGRMATAGTTAQAMTDGAANGSVSMKVTALPTGTASIVVRAANVNNAAQETLYYFSVTPTQFAVFRETPGVLATLFTGGTSAVNDVMKVTMSGGTLTFFQNSTQLFQLTGEVLNLTSRAVGLRLKDTTVRVDDFTVALTWTSIAAYVRAFTTERGQHETLGRYEAGVLTGLRLDNQDRRFEPLYASSPYYPYVLPGRTIRFQLDGVTVWRGNLEEFPLSWDDPYESNVELTGAGVFEQEANVELQSPWFYECQDVDAGKYNRPNRNNTSYPPLAAARGAYRFNGNPYNTNLLNGAASAAAGDGTISGDAKQGQQSLVYGDDPGSLAFGSLGTGKVVLPAATAPYGDYWSLEFLLQLSAISDPGAANFANAYYWIWSQPLKVYIMGRTSSPGTDDGKLFIQLDNPAGGSLTWKVSVSPKTGLQLDDGQPHHVLVQFGANLVGDGSLIIDGLSATKSVVGSSFTAGFVSPQAWNLGNSALGQAPKSGSMDELRVYTGAFWDFLNATAADFTAHYTFVSSPWAGDTTAQRLAKVIAYSGQPRTRFVVDQTSASTLQAETELDGKKLLDYLKILERTEGGPCYEQKDGKIRCAWRRARWYDTRSSVVQATLGDKPTNLAPDPSFETGSAGWVITGAPGWTDTGRVNVGATATVDGGSWVWQELEAVGSVNGNQRGVRTNNFIPATPGQTIAVTGWGQALDAAAGQFFVQIIWRDSGLSQLSSVVAPFVDFSTARPGAWLPSSVMGTAPASTAYADVYLVFNATGVAGRRYNADVANVTLIGSEQEYEQIEIVYTRDRVRNAFQGQHLQGNPVRRVNQASIDQLGERQWDSEDDLRNLADQDVRDRGDAIVTRWGYPGQDVREVVLHPVTSTDALWALLQGLEIGDLWEVRRTRPDGTRYVKQHYVEYVKFEVTSEQAPGDTIATVMLSPIEPPWGVAGTPGGSNVVGTALVSW